MTSYTGVVRAVRPLPGELFPLVNPHAQVNNPAQRLTFEVMTAELTGHTAIGTDDYTYTIGHAHRAMVACAAFLVDPVGLSRDTTNYNEYSVRIDGTEGFNQDSRYSLIANVPFEITRLATVANRTTAEGDAITIKITGSSSGRAINHGTRVYVVFYWV